MARSEPPPNRIALPVPVLSDREVHVWSLPLELPPATIARLEALLCPTERERAARFRFERHRHRFIAGRGLLRTILATYLGSEPAGLDFDYGPRGKPALVLRPGIPVLQFNLAHCDDLALLAVGKAGPLGVDLERVRPLEDVEDLVHRFFSTSEAAAFQSLPAGLKPAAFFNLWTRKEAWLKATGEGIAHSLNKVEVSFLPGEPARLLHLPIELGNPGAWSLLELAPAPGFTAALAAFGEPPKLLHAHWDPRGEDRTAPPNPGIEGSTGLARCEEKSP